MLFRANAGVRRERKLKMTLPRLAPKIASSKKIAQLQIEYATKGRLHIRDVLDPSSADAIYRCLSEQRQWNLVYRMNGEHIDSSAAAVAKWPNRKRLKLQKLIHREARNGFQYFYSTIPIYDIYHQKKLPGHFLNAVLEFLNSHEFLDFVRAIIQDDSVGFADAQATRYDNGNFLTCHDDDVAGKNRRAAYVLNFSPLWNPDWGGALQFFDSAGNIQEAYTPTHNALNLFRVPTNHSVGIVSPFAGAARYSITGWLRAGTDPSIV
jgi:Rps23 Pro-64 3,4-dihydroxylase Tpa1-like proline 4-hydroxylase